MKTIAGIPVFEIEFDIGGKLVAAAQLTALSDHLGGKGVTDLVLFAHGWNNDIKDARDLYTRYFAELGTLIGGGQPAGLAGRSFAGAVALWPSKKFTDKELIPGGAAGLGAAETAAVRAQLKALSRQPTRLGKATPVGAARQKKIDRATALLKTIETDAKAQEQFVDIIRSLLSDKAAHADDGTKDFFKVDAKVLLHGLSRPVLSAAPAGAGGAAALGAGGGAAGLRDIASSITAGVRRLLNFTTYYQMKERAGTIGTHGVAAVIRKLRQKSPQLRIHLVGHSFGGRVVTAAADAASDAADKVNSLTLLQAAYSHNGLAQKFDGKNDGFFRKIVTGRKVLGPIVVTCTRNDNAVGIAYPLASRLGGQNAAALGDANDPYGGIGRNGAVKTPESVNAVLAAANTPYQFEAGHVYNLNADAVIKDHSDICNPQVAWATLSAVAAS